MMREDMKNKPVPMCYGYQNAAPHVVYSSENTEGFIYLPDRTHGALQTHEDIDLVMLSDDAPGNIGRKVYVNLNGKYARVKPNTFQPIGNIIGDGVDLYTGNQYSRTNNYITIVGYEYPEYEENQEDPTLYRNPPQDNLLQIGHGYPPSSFRQYDSGDDYSHQFWYYDGVWGDASQTTYENFVSTVDGEVGGDFYVYSAFNNWWYGFVYFDRFQRKIHYQFEDIPDRAENTFIYERFHHWSPGAPEGFDDTWAYEQNGWGTNQPMIFTWHLIPNHSTPVVDWHYTGINGADFWHAGQIGAMSPHIKHKGDGSSSDTLGQHQVLVRPNRMEAEMWEEDDPRPADLSPVMMQADFEPGGGSSIWDQVGVFNMTHAYIKGLDKFQLYAQTAGRMDPSYVTYGGYGGHSGGYLGYSPIEFEHLNPTKMQHLSLIHI